MIKLGLTGGIGSGKSTITQMFRLLGVPVYVSDDRSKFLTQNNPIIIQGLKHLLGDYIYKDGLLDKKLMASLIFNDKDLLNEVNHLIHPVVFQDFADWVKFYEQIGTKYVVNEAAIMVESGNYKQMDKLLVVTADVETRVRRVIARDCVTEQQVRSRINNQISDDAKVALADFVIRTDDTHFVLPELLRIDKQLRN